MLLGVSVEDVPTPLCGTGGKESTKDAPNDDKGLKGFMPPKPVACGFNCGDNSEALEDVPVGLLHNESEKVEPLEVVAVLWESRNDGVKPIGDEAVGPVLS